MDKGKQKRKQQIPFLSAPIVSKFNATTYTNCNPSDINGFTLKKSEWEQIDWCLSQSQLFRLQHFHYNVGDCLFDALVVLLHFQYTSIEIREHTVNHFLVCLECGDLAALESLQTDLATDYLQDLHSISSVDDYLDRMSKTASQPNERKPLWPLG